MNREAKLGLRWGAALALMAGLAACGGTSSRRDGAAGGAGAAGGVPGAAGDKATSGGALAGGGGKSGSGGSPGGGSGSLGGSPSAGASPGEAGAAGEGAATGLSLPPGCTARAPTETADLCGLAVDCEGAPSVRTSCSRLDSDEWQCQCANSESMYRLANAAGLHACALAARLCAEPELQLGAESCEHTSAESDAESCGVEFVCSKPVELDAATDAQAWLLRFGSGRCRQWLPGRTFACDCLNGTEKKFHTVLADSFEPICSPFADFCSTRTEPSFEGDELCLLDYASSDGEGCGRAESCGPQLPLTEDVSLIRLDQRHASCTAAAGGGSECSCSTSSTGFNFRLATPPVDASCEAGMPMCAPSAVFERQGSPTCTPPDPGADDSDACDTFLRCEQAATVGDRGLVAYGSMNAVCRRLAPGQPWFCSCASGPDTARFELGATGANANQACAQASAACLQEPGLYLGMSADPMSPPDPLF